MTEAPMASGISGRGHLYRGDDYLCGVHYEINRADSEEEFALTDGLVQLAEPEEGPDLLDSLEPYEPLTLLLETPLPDGREQLPVRIEPYQGHRPDERFQIRIRD